jgi:glycerate 2-kinase
MGLKVLIAPDKFKGTLTAREAAGAMAEGWRFTRPQDQITLLPVSDGGDGFGELLGQLLGAEVKRVKTVNAARRPFEALWWWLPERRTAIIESARVIGLALLPPGQSHPFQLDTFGLGEVFKAAARHGASKCIVGLGGSATNDAGFGLAQALGWTFHDREGAEIREWTGLDQLDRVKPPKRVKLFRSLAIAVDVSNPLLGPRGASRVFGPQKGLETEDLPKAEKCLLRLAQIMGEQMKATPENLPGAGAAGGLGFGLSVFLRGNFKSGFDLFARAAGLDSKLKRAELVLTGEGAMDRSSAMGKGAGEVGRRCKRLGIPCLGLAGMLHDRKQLQRLFTEVHAIVPEVCDEAQAKKNPRACLQRLARRVAADRS